VEFQVENCPSCGHEDFHFGGGVWVCDCCGHSW
jgi:ribosomal protein L37AE/L43A